jgi:hypothetical protein
MIFLRLAGVFNVLGFFGDMINGGLINSGNDNYPHVRIGDIELGVKRDTAPDTSKPNPSSIHLNFCLLSINICV